MTKNNEEKTAKNKWRKETWIFYLDLLQRRETMLMITWVNSTQVSLQMTSLFIFISLVPCKVPRIYRTFKNTIYKLRAECVPETETYWVTQKKTCSWNRQANYPNLNKNRCDNIFHEKKSTCHQYHKVI